MFKFSHQKKSGDLTKQTSYSLIADYVGIKMDKDDYLFVILLENCAGQLPGPTTIEQHIEFLRDLDRTRTLVLCGPFQEHPGGMIIVRAADLTAAQVIALSDPFVTSGVKTCQVRTWQMAHAMNNYLG